MQISPAAAKRHVWTQGDGPNYSSNIVIVGVGTIVCAVIGSVSLASYIGYTVLEITVGDHQTLSNQIS